MRDLDEVLFTFVAATMRCWWATAKTCTQRNRNELQKDQKNPLTGLPHFFNAFIMLHNLVTKHQLMALSSGHT